jgi:hypothetical protein
MFYNPCIYIPSDEMTRGVDKVIILNTEGSFVREITTNGSNYNLLYNERNDQLLLRQKKGLCCINLDGHVIFICFIILVYIYLLMR